MSTAWNAGRKVPPEPLSPDEVTALIKASGGKSTTAVRNQALFVLLWRSGLRISEALALGPKDLDVSAGTVRVLHGKGDKARTVGLDPTAVAVVSRWIDRRASLGMNGKQPLFCTHKGGSLSPQYVGQALRRTAARAGLEKRVHAHGMRHTHATELAREGVDLSIIQRQLGHASLEHTARYIQAIAPTKVIAAMQERTWSFGS